MNKVQKEAAVKDLSAQFKDAAAIFVTHYRGLKVSEITQLRAELNGVQARMLVVKNRLMKRALGKNSAGLEKHLLGPTSITFANEDPVGAAKVLAKYQKEFEPLEIKAGLMHGELIDLKQIEALAELPSKEELYAKLLGTLLASASSIVRALQGTSEKLVRALAAVRDTKE